SFSDERNMDSYDLKKLPVRISDVIKPWAERSPERLALVEASGQWTYGELAAAVSETEVWLHELGIRPGDRIMIVCENSRAFAVILLAAANLDVWSVLVNARLAASEVDKIQQHCGARRVFYTTSVSPHATAHAKRQGAAVQDVGRLGQIGVGPL